MEQSTNERNLYPSSSDPLVPRAFSSNALDEYISIEAVNPHGSSVHFKIRSHSPLEKLMRAYCSRENLPLHSVAFLYNGTRIDPHHTPHSLGMMENDIIDILLEKDWGEHFATNQLHPSQSVPSNIKSNDKRKSHERSEPVINQFDSSIHNRIHMNIHNSNNTNNNQSNNNKEKEKEKEVNKEHKSIHKSIHKPKDKTRKKEVIRSENVIRMGNIAFITDCFGDDKPINNNDINNNIFENQCKFALNNLKEKVEKVGMKLKEVGRIRVYLLNISNYEEFCNILKTFFGEKYSPIVSVVEVSKLRRPHSLLEIEADVIHVKRK